MSINKETDTEIATVAGGCFWCIEAVYRQVPGVIQALSGYMGGAIENPSYESVCQGQTGHAEVVQLTFSSRDVTYSDLLTIFFAIHDPTQLNRQGNDIGTQYRSAIFTHDPKQAQQAEAIIQKLSDSFNRPIVTTIEEADVFYPAEDYHQAFWQKNPSNPYCNLLIPEKLAKLNHLLEADK